MSIMPSWSPSKDDLTVIPQWVSYWDYNVYCRAVHFVTCSGLRASETPATGCSRSSDPISSRPHPITMQFTCFGGYNVPASPLCRGLDDG